VATDDGYIKQTMFKDYLPGRTYKNHPSVYIKLKSDDARVTSIIYRSASTDNETVLLMSYNGLALRFDVTEVPVNGARTSGVKSMGLKDDDQVVNMQIVKDNDNVAIITTRGAFKAMKLEEIPVTSRARKGVLILRELKSSPHRVADFIAYAPDFKGAFDIITNRPTVQEVLSEEHGLGSRYSNGSFILDVETQGIPVTIRQKLLELVL